MPTTAPDVGGAPPKLRSPDRALALPPPLPRWRRAGRSLARFVRRSPMSAFWGLVALAIVFTAVAAPVLAPHDPLKSNFRIMTKAPSANNYFGTDQIGRDTLSRVIWGSRTSLTVAFFAVLLGTTLGALWGLACGFLVGRFDIGSQRAIEFMRWFPDLVLGMAIAMSLGAGTGTLIVPIDISRLPFGGRVIRSVALSLKELPFVEAARGLGASNRRLMFR